MKRRNFLSFISMGCLCPLDLLNKKKVKITKEEEIINLLAQSIINQENISPKIDPTIHNPYYVVVYNNNISGRDFVGGRVIVEFEKNLLFSKSWEIDIDYAKKHNVKNHQIIFSITSLLREHFCKFDPNVLITYELKHSHGLRPFISTQNNRCVDLFYLCKNGYWYNNNFKRIYNFPCYPNDIFKHVNNQTVRYEIL